MLHQVVLRNQGRIEHSRRSVLYRYVLLLVQSRLRIQNIHLLCRYILLLGCDWLWQELLHGTPSIRLRYKQNLWLEYDSWSRGLAFRIPNIHLRHSCTQWSECAAIPGKVLQNILCRFAGQCKWQLGQGYGHCSHNSLRIHILPRIRSSMRRRSRD